jgi:hypothetical protein
MNPVVSNFSSTAKPTGLIFFHKISEKVIELKNVLGHRQFV